MENREGSEGEYTSKGLVPGRCVQAHGETVRVVVPGQGAAARPQVELIREGEVIRAIDIVCVCGQRIHLVCEYGK
jgi:hypothetical protein